MNMSATSSEAFRSSGKAAAVAGSDAQGTTAVLLQEVHQVQAGLMSR